jgi:hypothetical protein
MDDCTGWGFFYNEGQGVEDKIWRGLISVFISFLFPSPWRMRLFSSTLKTSYDVLFLFFLQLLDLVWNCWNFLFSLRLPGGPRCEFPLLLLLLLLVLYLSSFE